MSELKENEMSDSFSKDLLNRGYTKGYTRGYQQGKIDERAKIIKMLKTEALEECYNLPCKTLGDAIELIEQMKE